MRAINLFIGVMLMLVIASCSDSDKDLFSETSLFESIRNVYGIETVSALSKVDNVPSVSLTEMEAVLEALRQESNQKKKCLVESANGISFGGTNEKNKKVVMDNKYIVATRSGITLENFLLRVELKFNYQNNQVFYYGTDYMYDSELFDWRADGLSLNPAKNTSGFVYEFESESFLYFKVKDEGDCLVKVGVVFKGVFDFEAENGTYSFQLQKYSK